MLTDVCDLDVEPDGLRFDAGSMKAERITEDAHYHGLRIRFPAHLGPSRVMLQIDLGFGDTVFRHRSRSPTLRCSIFPPRFF